MPRWMAAHPYLSSGLLACKNACRYRRGRTLLVTALIILGGGVVAVLPPTGPILRWLGQNWAVTFVIAASVFTSSTARRRQRASIAAATSWQASLPVRSPVWMQVVAGVLRWLAAVTALAAFVWAIGGIGHSDFSGLAFATAAGAVVGLLGGWRLPRAGIGAPGFHYAIVRRPRVRWASAPSLLPLANWPAAQGRFFSRPRKTAPLVLFAMLALPMGSPGQVALAVAAACIALFSVFTLSVAAVRVAFDAARWLAPTTVGKLQFTAALIWRVTLTQIVVLAVLLLLTSTVYRPWALAVGMPLAVEYVCGALAAAGVAALVACRRVGLGASGRGA